jgi:hypothetical protein
LRGRRPIQNLKSYFQIYSSLAITSLSLDSENPVIGDGLKGNVVVVKRNRSNLW